MSDTDSGRKPIAQHTGTTVPNRDSNAHRQVPLPNRFPCTTILIHGVNDLGTDFETVEGGLCEGLNDRLGRMDLKAGTYTHGRMANDPTPVAAADLMKNLDDVIYRRQEPEGTFSPLIPFYWGFKANANDLAKQPSQQTVNGQYVDQFGNRLDSHRAKGGGMFANATTNIPDMFNTNFKGGKNTERLNRANNDPTHPLLEAPSRHYMVLAALRLAALVRQIRLIDSDGTVNIIAHSQGTLISLLAQALLVDGLFVDGKLVLPANRPADTLILIDSPYSYAESIVDQVLQSGDDQQTIWARVKTLANLTGLVASGKHGTPKLEQLQYVKGGPDNHGITGSVWRSDNATRMQGPQGKTSLVFAERDNRGKTYVYFCPEDATVGLRGVNGIGSIGLPNSIKTGPAQNNAKAEDTGLVSDTLRQRVFTRRLRGGKPVQVGTPPGPYNLREHGESSHGSNDLKRAPIAENTMRNINGEELPPPFNPELEKNRRPGNNVPLGGKSPNEFEAGTQSIDQLEAETALSALPTATTRKVMQWPPDNPNTGYAENVGYPTPEAVQTWLNQGKAPDDQCTVIDATDPGEGETIVVNRTLTPNEQKVQLMNSLTPIDSYHSGVMSGRLNHRCATAFDVSIGQARAIDNPDWAKLLRAIADWRIPMKTIEKAGGGHQQLDAMTYAIVDANCTYYKDGKFPSDKIPTTPPAPVVSETVKIKYEQNPPFQPSPF
jgi:hypothetical protein